jgi:hypothetical protein
MRSIKAPDKKRVARLLKQHIMGTSVHVALDSLDH